MSDAAIAGIDEAGRGALAGPVVAGACVLPFALFKRRSIHPRWSPLRRIPSGNDCLIADSKQLSPEEREIAFQWIQSHCAYGVGMADASMIESIGILRATELAMRLALEDVRQKIDVTKLLIDGRDAFTFDLPHRSIIRGDATEPCIAAASIVAKVSRDRLMTELRHQYPRYGFEQHKGYGTSVHIASIRQHGPSPIHRLSFLSRIA